jgi:hypothetical protein
VAGRAKDAWMPGIVLSLVLDEITERGRRGDG